MSVAPAPPFRCSDAKTVYFGGLAREATDAEGAFAPLYGRSCETGGACGRIPPHATLCPRPRSDGARGLGGLGGLF